MYIPGPMFQNSLQNIGYQAFFIFQDTGRKKLQLVPVDMNAKIFRAKQTFLSYLAIGILWPKEMTNNALTHQLIPLQ